MGIVYFESREYMKDKIWVIGGDQRTKFLIQNLIESGYFVLYTGVDVNHPLARKMSPCDSSVIELKAIILPIRGIKEDTIVQNIKINEEFFEIHNKTPIFTGIMTKYLEEKKKLYNLNIIVLNAYPLFNEKNSIATAEVVLKMIIESTNTILSESKIIVLGNGASGSVIAEYLKYFQADVVIVARSEESRKKAIAKGIRAINFDKLEQEISNSQIIINTVPALVLKEKELKGMPLTCEIIDIASFPGGVDYEYSKKMGISATLCPGLPGLYAPKTSGIAQAKAIIEVLSRHES